MPDFEETVPVHAPAEAVFAWCSDLSNLPHYLPTLARAERRGEDRIRVEGVVRGHRYETQGEFHADPERLRMWWGSEGDRQYKGWLQVEPAGDHADVTVHLHFSQDNQSRERMREEGRDPDQEIRQGMISALDTLRQMIEERHGGTVRRVVGRDEARADRDYPQPPIA